MAAASKDGPKGTEPVAKGGEALICFTTKLPDEFQVPEDQLVVPSSLARYGLSEVVNRMMGNEKVVPFDFLVDGEFLRSDILGYLNARKLSSEKVLKLEYIFALSEPEEQQIDQVPDWVAGLAALGQLPCEWMVSSSYDGAVRLYEAGTARLCARLSRTPLTSMAAQATGDGSSCRLALAGKDGSVRCCQLRYASSPAIGPVTTLQSADHKRPVQAVAISEDGEFLASGGWDQEVLIWNAGAAAFAAPPDEAQEGKGIKRKAGSEEQSPKFVLRGHSQVVSALAFGTQARFPFTLLSASWDCTVRVWDTVAASCVCNWAVARATTSFSMCLNPAQMATSHEDGHISLWDIRAPAHATSPNALSLDASAGLPLSSTQLPHSRMASQVVWHPTEVNRLASVGHDGNLCVLDPRSPKMPLQKVRIGKSGPVPTKLLCVTWLGREELAVGGSDGRVVRLTMTQGKAVDE